jgi:hypothetical protein
MLSSAWNSKLWSIDLYDVPVTRAANSVDKLPVQTTGCTHQLSNGVQEDSVAPGCLMSVPDLVNSIDYDDITDTIAECKASRKRM